MRKQQKPRNTVSVLHERVVTQERANINGVEVFRTVTADVVVEVDLDEAKRLAKRALRSKNKRAGAQGLAARVVGKVFRGTVK